jgi:hypothetical protein
MSYMPYMVKKKITGKHLSLMIRHVLALHEY